VSEWELDEKTERQLTRETITILARYGVIEDHSINDEEIQKTNRERSELVYKNTLLLLKRYRKLRWSIAMKLAYNADIEAEDIYKENTDALVQHFFKTCENSNHLKAVFKSTEFSEVLMRKVENAIENLKTYPDHVAGQNYYDIIYKTYVSEKYRSVQHIDKIIANELGISRATYYNQKDEAINLISIQLWGADKRALLISTETIVMLNRYDSEKNKENKNFF
jgi:hypothetical protein